MSFNKTFCIYSIYSYITYILLLRNKQHISLTVSNQLWLAYRSQGSGEARQRKAGSQFRVQWWINCYFRLHAVERLDRICVLHKFVLFNCSTKNELQRIGQEWLLADWSGGYYMCWGESWHLVGAQELERVAEKKQVTDWPHDQLSKWQGDLVRYQVRKSWQLYRLSARRSSERQLEEALGSQCPPRAASLWPGAAAQGRGREGLGEKEKEKGQASKEVWAALARKTFQGLGSDTSLRTTRRGGPLAHPIRAAGPGALRRLDNGTHRLERCEVAVWVRPSGIVPCRARR